MFGGSNNTGAELTWTRLLFLCHTNPYGNDDMMSVHNKLLLNSRSLTHSSRTIQWNNSAATTACEWMERKPFLFKSAVLTGAICHIYDEHSEECMLTLQLLQVHIIHFNTPS